MRNLHRRSRKWFRRDTPFGTAPPITPGQNQDRRQAKGELAEQLLDGKTLRGRVIPPTPAAVPGALQAHRFVRAYDEPDRIQEGGTRRWWLKKRIITPGLLQRHRQAGPHHAPQVLDGNTRRGIVFHYRLLVAGGLPFRRNRPWDWMPILVGEQWSTTRRKTPGVSLPEYDLGIVSSGGRNDCLLTMGGWRDQLIVTVGAKGVLISSGGHNDGP